MRKPATGEPCAGELHARFGGRGGQPSRPLSETVNRCDVRYQSPRGVETPNRRSIGFEIFHPGIAHDGDDGCIRAQLVGQPHCGDDIAARGGPGKQALFPSQPQRHGHGLVRRDPLDPIGDARLPQRHDKPRADPVNLVRACRTARQNRRFSRLHGNDLEALSVAAQGLRVPRSDAAVPTLWTKPSMRPPVCRQSSSAMT